jgi:hypothetical protein
MADVTGQTAHCVSEAGDWPLFSARQPSDPDEESDGKDREADERDFLQRTGPRQREPGLCQHGLVPLQPVTVRITFMTSSKPKNARLTTATAKINLTPCNALISA